MAVNLDNILTLVRAELADPGKTRWSDSDLKTWINLGRRDVARKALIFEAYNSSITTVGGTQEYSLPADFIAPKSVAWKEWDLSQISRRDTQFPTQAQGTPTGFYLWAGKVGLYPIPDSAATLELWYYKTPSDLSAGTDTIDLTLEDETLYVLYTVARAKAQDQDWGESFNYQAQYENHLLRHENLIRGRLKLGPQLKENSSISETIRTGKVRVFIP